jgi:hypothetical protein
VDSSSRADPSVASLLLTGLVDRRASYRAIPAAIPAAKTKPAGRPPGVDWRGVLRQEAQELAGSAAVYQAATCSYPHGDKRGTH